MRSIADPNLRLRQSDYASFQEQPGLLSVRASDWKRRHLEDLRGLHVTLEVVEVPIIIHGASSESICWRSLRLPPRTSSSCFLLGDARRRCGRDPLGRLAATRRPDTRLGSAT